MAHNGIAALRERLARVELKTELHCKQLVALQSVSTDHASTLALLQTVARRLKRWGQGLSWVLLSLLAEALSGAWGRLFGKLAELVGKALG